MISILIAAVLAAACFARALWLLMLIAEDRRRIFLDAPQRGVIK